MQFSWNLQTQTFITHYSQLMRKVAFELSIKSIRNHYIGYCSANTEFTATLAAKTNVNFHRYLSYDFDLLLSLLLATQQALALPESNDL